MGKHQCPACGHITTGFEAQEWDIRQSALRELVRAVEKSLGPRSEAMQDALITARAALCEHVAA